MSQEEVKKASFWIGQIFVLAATVTGVYLASSQGFKQAIAYEKLMSYKSNYYLRQSLKSELSDNVKLVKEYQKRLERGSVADRQMPFALDTFIWESMKFSSATLETPSELLTGSRRFYREVADIQLKVATSKISAQEGVKRLQALVENMEKNVFPAFDKNAESLYKILTENGIEL